MTYLWHRYIIILRMKKINNSIITTIYLNDLENKKIPVSNKYFLLNKKVHNLITQLKNEVNEEQNKILIKIEDYFIDLLAEYEKTAYIAGFKSGLELAVEALINLEE